MNMPIAVAAQLSARGHDVVHIRDLGLGHLPDEAVFELAQAENRILVTFDLDFGLIERLASDGRTSVVILRLRSVRAFHIAGRLNVALATAGAALIVGALAIVDDSRIRIRPYAPTED